MKRSVMRPMKAATPESLDDLIFPLLISTKFDGIRAVVRDGRLLSSRLTPIKNQVLQDLYGRPELNGLDGELVLPLEIGDFNATSGQCRSEHDPAKNIVFRVFDDFSNPKLPFTNRLNSVNDTCFAYRREFPDLSPVYHETVHTLNELLIVEKGILKLGYEGVMARHPHGPYKFGRSTMREHWLMKIKRFTDAEARIIGFEEQMQNTNPLGTNELGKAKRSKHQEGMVGKNTLGALLCVGLNGRFKGVNFKVAGGDRESHTSMDDALRQEIWKNQSKYLGKGIVYKFFEPGSKDRPRHAGFKCFLENKHG